MPSFIRHEESWLAKPELSLVFNSGINKLDMNRIEYFMILGSDTILEDDYVKKVISNMNDDIVIASGVIAGEDNNMPRGSGRIFKVSFWKKHIIKFPYAYSWESYPLYKTLALGYRLYVCKEEDKL